MAGSSLSANIASSSISPGRSSSKMSATELSYGDLLVEILSWLPVVSLLRFRFVCKSWFNLITHDSTLVKMHLLHHHNLQFDKCSPTILLSTQNFETIYSLNLKRDDNDNGLSDTTKLLELVHSFKNLKSTDKSECLLDFLGSCNGLICIKVYSIDKYHNIDESTIYIWNPSTKEFKQIPDSPVEFPMNSDHDSPIKTTYGFGYDKNIDDYKVIRCVQESNIPEPIYVPYEYMWEPNVGEYHDLCSELKVYTLGANSWRRIHQQIPYEMTKQWDMSKPGLLVSGSLHWISFSSCRFDRIISFDIVDEEYGEVPKPDILNHDDHYVGIQVLRGCLCLHSRLRRTNDFCIWMMMDYGVKESWTKLFIINDPDEIDRRITPLWLFKNGEILDRKITPLWLSKNGEILTGIGYRDLVLCYPKFGKVKFVPYRSPDFSPSKICYIGSLVSLKSGTYMDRKQVKQIEEDPEQAKGGEDDREQTNN